MELKSKFGKYKVKDVDSYIAQITANHALKTDNLERAIAELTQKNEELASFLISKANEHGGGDNITVALIFK